MQYRGRVVAGEKVGRTIGFPTFNLVDVVLDENFEYGVYAAKVSFLEFSGYAAVHYGPRKTLDNKITIELHVLNYDDFDLKPEFIEFEVLEKVRGTLRFSSLLELQKQIKLDVVKINKIVDKYEGFNN